MLRKRFGKGFSYSLGKGSVGIVPKAITRWQGGKVARRQGGKEEGGKEAEWQGSGVAMKVLEDARRP